MGKDSRPGKWSSRDCRLGRLYNTPAWKKLRLQFLAENPLCVYCDAKGVVKGAEVVDHIKPHKGDQRLFWAESNWQALCFKCHDNDKRREELAARRPAIGPDGWPLGD